MDIRKQAENIFILLVSFCLSFYILSIKKELFIDPSAVANYLKSPYFNLFFPVFSAASFAILKLISLAVKLRSKPSIAAASIILALQFSLYYFKYLNIYTSTLSCLLAGTLAYLFFRYLNPAIPNDEERNTYLSAVIGVSTVLGLLSFIRVLSYYNSYNTMTDMAIHLNTLWQYANGAAPYSWMEGDFGNLHRFGVHFQPVSFLFAGIYKLFPYPGLLLFIQSAVPFAGIIYFYLLSEKILKNSSAAFFLSLAFAISPFLAQSVDYDFHFDFFYVLLLPAFLYFAESGFFLRAGAIFALSIITKEEITIYMIFASVFAYTRTLNKRYFILTLAGIVYAVLVIGFLMPAFHAYGTTHAGRTLEIARNFTAVFSSNIMGQFLICYMAGVLFLPFIPGPALLLIFAPPVLVQLVNTQNWSKLFFYQYHAMTLTALFVCALYNIPRLSRRVQPVTTAFIIFFLQLFLQTAYAPAAGLPASALTPLLATALLPFALSFPGINGKIKIYFTAISVIVVFWAGYFSFNAYRGNIDPQKSSSMAAAIKLLPADTSVPVIAEANITSHITGRKYLADPAFYHGNSYSVLNRIIRVKAGRFYVLKTLPENANMTEIERLAIKLKFKASPVYEDNNAALFVYVR